MILKLGGRCTSLSALCLICFLSAIASSCFKTSFLTLAYQNCSTETGGGICPDGNTCCLMQDGKSGCIPSDLGKYRASCCSDDDDDDDDHEGIASTGCGAGYICRTEEYDCLEINATSTTTKFDPIVKVLPRYRLCRSSNIQQEWGFQLDEESTLAYYSSHGPIENIMDVESQIVDMVVVVIHGAGRNADDYFCSMSAATELQNTYKNVLIIAPHFYSESDVRDDDSFLYWENISDGPWRYGANSLGPTQMSSYTALDRLVEEIRTRFPHLHRIVVGGHSSGGQMVQRWTFLTPTWSQKTMKALVANPSSYVYLSPFRLIHNKWTLPEKPDCPQYNQWEWGLEEGGDLDVPYKQRLLRNVSFAIEQYSTRSVDYLVGSLDVCNVSTPTLGWCNSHGLETKCMDELQGLTRYERSTNYIASLRRIGISEMYHAQMFVNGVGHDHSLMFQSPEGLKSLFGPATDMEQSYESKN